jgi:hypothetical protein
VNKIRFLDSFSFFPKSLRQLIEVQKSDDFNSFPLLKQHLLKQQDFSDGEMYDLLTCKGIYPYDYYNSTARLSEEQLPSITSFYDSLYERQCTTVDYEFAKRVWAKGGCKNGWDYCRLYLASDVLTLLDIVCKNTDKIYGEFGLDLGYYFSTPHLVMDLFLKISKEEISLITDVDQSLFVKRSMRGRYIFHGDRILETDLTEQDTGVTSVGVCLSLNSLYPSALSRYSVRYANYK